MDGGRAKLTDVNPHLVCVLCHGYFVDATTIAECLHSFCRSCIFRQLERKSICPICEVQVHNTKLHLSLRLDKTLQDIVYKLVPGLFHNEMQRRRDFYKNHPYRDEHLDPESRGVGLDRLIYSPDDLISLSLEFYDDELEREEWSSNNNNSPRPAIEKENEKEKTSGSGTKRYLQCPAGFKMAHLKKFIRQKYGLAPNCNVEILYRRESLPDSYSLMDIAYIYTWKRNGPMRFYYRMPDIVQKQILPVDWEAKKDISDKPEEVTTVSDAKSNHLEDKLPKLVPISNKKMPNKLPSQEKLAIEQSKEISPAIKEAAPSSPKSSPATAKVDLGSIKDCVPTPEPIPSSNAVSPASYQASKPTPAVPQLTTEASAPTQVSPSSPKPSLPTIKISSPTTKNLSPSMKTSLPTVESKPDINSLSKSPVPENSVSIKDEKKELSTPQEIVKIEPVKEEATENHQKPEENINTESSILSNGVAAPRTLSKQDELSVSVLLSLGTCRVAEKDEPPKSDHQFLMPKPVTPKSATPKAAKDFHSKKILNGKLNPKFSVNKIASELAQNNRLNAKKLSWQRPEIKKESSDIKANTVEINSVTEKADPFAFHANDISTKNPPNGTSHPAKSPAYKPMYKTPEPTVPPLKISLHKGSLPRIEPSVQSVPKPRTPTPPASQNGIVRSPERPEVTVKTTNGSLTITTQPPLGQEHNSPTSLPGNRSPNGQHQKINGKRMNGNVVTIVPETKAKENGMNLSTQSNVNSRLPIFPKQPRKNQVVPGGVISKTGPTLDQRIQQLYKNQNNRLNSVQSPLMNQAPATGKQPESRLANWLNNRFPPQQKTALIAEQTKAPTPPKSEDKQKDARESEAAKLSREMSMLKRKLDEFRSVQSVCEITQENPNPELAKKRRDVTPDVSIEFMRAADMKKVDAPPKPKEKPLKRPVPALKAIQEMDMAKRKSVEEDKTNAKKPKLMAKKDEEALDLSGAGKPSVELAQRMALLHQNGRLVPPQQHPMPWMLNRPLLANHFLPRTT